MTLNYDLSGNDLVVNSISVGAAAGTQTGILMPAYEYIMFTPTTTAGSFTVFTNPTLGGTYKIAAVTSTFATASTSGTVQVEVCTGTQAPGSGTVQLTGTTALSGTANTPANGTMIASPTTIAAGNRVSVTLGGTLTSLVNGQVTIALQRIS